MAVSQRSGSGEKFADSGGISSADDSTAVTSGAGTIHARIRRGWSGRSRRARGVPGKPDGPLFSGARRGQRLHLKL